MIANNILSISAKRLHHYAGLSTGKQWFRVLFMIIIFSVSCQRLTLVDSFRCNSATPSPRHRRELRLTANIIRLQCSHALPVCSFRQQVQLFAVKDTIDNNPPDRRAGILVLFTVPIAWGTFEPAVRYVYDIQPNVPPFVFQFVYYFIASSSLLTVSTMPLFSPNISKAKEETVLPDDVANISKFDRISIRGGLELGTYLFLGNGLQVVGLKTVPSDRAAFLLQLTTIFVPLVQSLAAGKVSILPVRTWLACFMALAGVSLIGLDGSSGDNGGVIGGNAGLVFSRGDLYIVLAALFYTFHCLRLETFAKKTSAIELAVSKASTETLWCVLVIAAALVATTTNGGPFPLFDIAKTSGENILEYRQSVLKILEDASLPSEAWIKLGAATTWIALVTIAYTITAQSYGQARVPPATANLIYTVQPLCTAVIAFLVLGETLGPFGYGGGLLIGSAVLLVIQSEEES